MKKFNKVFHAFALTCFFMSHTIYAENTKLNYTVLNAKMYQQIVSNSRQKVKTLLFALQKQPRTADDTVAFLAKALQNKPYLFIGAAGEGDWQPDWLTYHKNALHVAQYPVYRLDGFDCQTFVEVVLALMHAQNLATFDEAFIKIAYGATNSQPLVRYTNRNHFVDADFNIFNERSGLLQDATSLQIFKPLTQTIKATIDRNQWIALQHPHAVTVLNQKDAQMMYARFQSFYTVKHSYTEPKLIKINYLPKMLFIKQQANYFVPNQFLLDHIPTPSVVEVIHDPKIWRFNGLPIQKATGTELTVSHLGLLYRQVFKLNQVIYYQTTCHLPNINQQPVCDVTAHLCKTKVCKELMLVHATDLYPNGYRWVKSTKGRFFCEKPNFRNRQAGTCNRVESKPFFDYLIDNQYGLNWLMARPSIVGIHLEMILNHKV